MGDVDWVRLADLDVPDGTLLPGTCIEMHRADCAGPVRAVLFDFDGTLSLIRSGWVDVMVPMMVEVLMAEGASEDPGILDRTVREFVTRLTGTQTVYQMIELARQVHLRGGTPLDPLDYKHRYLDRLWSVIKSRIADLRAGRVPQEAMLVPGSIQLLEALKAREMKIFIASGTDEKYATREAALLGLDRYVDGKIYGAIDDYKNYSKRMVIQRIIAEHTLAEGELLGFGDGYVEIEDVKSAGGIAVGVATDEPECHTVDQWKRARLILAGADVIIPNYLEYEHLLETICDSD